MLKFVNAAVEILREKFMVLNADVREQKDQSQCCKFLPKKLGTEEQSKPK